MIKTTIPIAIVALVLIVPSGTAAHCQGTVTQIDAGTETVYVDDRGDDSALDLWIYVESNGQAGLQRGSEVLIPLPETGIITNYDPCAVPDGDLRLF